MWLSAEAQIYQEPPSKEEIEKIRKEVFQNADFIFEAIPTEELELFNKDSSKYHKFRKYEITRIFKGSGDIHPGTVMIYAGFRNVTKSYGGYILEDGLSHAEYGCPYRSTPGPNSDFNSLFFLDKLEITPEVAAPEADNLLLLQVSNACYNVIAYNGGGFSKTHLAAEGLFKEFETLGEVYRFVEKYLGKPLKIDRDSYPRLIANYYQYYIKEKGKSNRNLEADFKKYYPGFNPPKEKQRFPKTSREDKKYRQYRKDSLIYEIQKRAGFIPADTPPNKNKAKKQKPPKDEPRGVSKFLKTFKPNCEAFLNFPKPPKDELRGVSKFLKTFKPNCEAFPNFPKPSNRTARRF